MFIIMWLFQIPEGTLCEFLVWVSIFSFHFLCLTQSERLQVSLMLCANLEWSCQHFPQVFMFSKICFFPVGSITSLPVHALFFRRQFVLYHSIKYKIGIYVQTFLLCKSSKHNLCVVQLWTQYKLVLILWNKSVMKGFQTCSFNTGWGRGCWLW